MFLCYFLFSVIIFSSNVQQPNATATDPWRGKKIKQLQKKTGTPEATAQQQQPIIPPLLNTAINLARPIPPVQEYPCNPPPIPPPPEKYYASTEICKVSFHQVLLYCVKAAKAIYSYCN